MTAAAGSHFNLGTTWTIEYWSKATGASVSAPITVMGQQYDAGSNIDIFYYNGRLCVKNGTGGLCAEPTPGVWTHVALVSNAGTVTVYYDGVQQFSALVNYSLSDTTTPLYIGRRGTGDFQYFNGKITNIRITDTVVYTGTFVPTVLPLKITGTKLLWTPNNRSIVADSSDIASTMTNYRLVYNTDYPYEFAYEAINPHGYIPLGVLTMTKSINGLSVQAGASNFDDPPAQGSYITIDGVTVASDSSIGVGVNMTRGHTMVVVNKETNAIESINVYDSYGSPTIIEAPLAAVAAGRIVILVTYDATSCTATMRNTLVNSYGASTPGSYATWTTERVSQLFIGVKR
jgi:hypothetical protein